MGGSVSGRVGPTDTISLLRSMTVGINQQFDYRRRVERGVQTPSETLQRGHGSCRDFAVLMMEGVRALGFAARFVSGYIFLPDADPKLSCRARFDPRVAASLPSRDGLGRFRPNQ